MRSRKDNAESRTQSRAARSQPGAAGAPGGASSTSPSLARPSPPGTLLAARLQVPAPCPLINIPHVKLGL